MGERGHRPQHVMQVGTTDGKQLSADQIAALGLDDEDPVAELVQPKWVRSTDRRMAVDWMDRGVAVARTQQRKYSHQFHRENASIAHVESVDGCHLSPEG